MLGCSVPAKFKLTNCVKLGVRPCCFKVKCTPGEVRLGAISCDGGNFYVGNDSEQKASRNSAQYTSRAPKHPREDDERSVSRAEKAGKATTTITAAFEISNCLQVCRTFIRGRCIKSNDTTLAVGDPRRCTEMHDKPKSEIKCCSILKLNDELYHKGFTKCRYQMIGEECEYKHEKTMQEE